MPSRLHVLFKLNWLALLFVMQLGCSNDSQIDGWLGAGSTTGAKLVFTNQPQVTDWDMNLSSAVLVEIQNENGETITSGPDAVVSVTLTLDYGSGSLVGSTTRPAVLGVASFPSLRMDLAGGTKRLRATATLSSGLKTILSDNFTVDQSLQLLAGQTQSFATSGGAAPYAYSIVFGGGTIDSVTGLYTAPVDCGSTAIRVTDANGTTADSTITLAPLTASVAPAYPTNGSDLLDYVKVSDPFPAGSRISQPDIACNATTDGPTWLGCLHGGEIRKVVATGFTSCASLTAQDTLGLFDWTCELSGGSAVFYSTGFKKGRGLRHLVNSVPEIRENAVTVSRGACTVLSSSPATWWTNSIEAAPINDGGADAVNLSGTGKIFVVTDNASTNGYFLSSSKTALVTLPGKVLRYAGRNFNNTADSNGQLLNGGAATERRVASAGNQDFIWFEGSFNTNRSVGAVDADRAIGVDGSRFVRVHNSELTGGSTSLHYRNCAKILTTSVRTYSNSIGVRYYDVTNSGLFDTHAHDSSWFGLKFSSGSWNNVFQQVSTSSSGGGIWLFMTSSNVLSEAVLSNNDTGLVIEGWGAEKNTIQHITAPDNDTAVQMNGGSSLTQNYLRNLLITNSTSRGVSIENSPDGNQFDDIVISGSGSNEIFLDTGSTNNRFRGSLKLGAGGCANTGTGNELDGSCLYGPGSSTPVSLTDLTQTFSALVSLGDALNSADVAGVAAFTGLSDWINFENRFRSWGRANAVPYPYSVRGRCTSGNCQINDWRLRSDNTAVRAVNGTFTPGAACPSSVNASTVANVLTDGDTRTFLRNATERFGDFIGNDNGLCESSEACIFAPNTGAYQGSDELSSTACTFNGGNGVTGVTLFGSTTNGVSP